MILSRFEGLRILAPPGVYAPRSDTALLASAIGDVRGARVLELCAGSGALALLAARRGAAQVLAVDCSLRAVATVRANARLNRLGVQARRGDLLDALAAHERFDVILANPPYLPALGPKHDDRWDAGSDGRAVLDRIIDGAAGHLTPAGRLMLVQSQVADVHSSSARLLANELRVTDVVEHKGPWGPLASARREQLVERGLLAREDQQETLVVLTASSSRARVLPRHPSPEQASKELATSTGFGA